MAHGMALTIAKQDREPDIYKVALMRIADAESGLGMDRHELSREAQQ